eukprot:CAMPEP_0172305464 /NCGR_PEP_ID=MMETSP1058-20130122/6739_1 /TAXON_ID=83371 /ORGANISM="Detonula confervacea, Strain CCMP 353" /LENGTH=667 /DNA_ID=CAMNT_0013017069 /DNA_START=202 /DNA_END=2206 /DNA_ORIENTATION=+
MGTCQSRQPVVVIIDTNLRKPTVLASINPNVLGSTPSVASQTTGITRDSTEPLLDHQGHHKENDHPILVDPITTIISDVSVPSIQSDDAVFLSQGTKHVMKKSGMVKDYLQSEGANRAMVHIETPFGLPIEEVYDGVHTGEVLGEGIAGKVRRITHRGTGIQRAVKRLDLDLVTRDEDLNRLLDEIKIMCCLDHPNVVCLEEVFEGENELFLTQELCEGGDMFDRLEVQPNECYTEAGCARLIKQIIGSVSYLHSKDIIHRDLKLENFLFSSWADDSELKMIDFGLSKHFVLGEVQHEFVGTPYTVAPEVILGEGYDEKCDVWGIGVITYLLLSGITPFGGACEGEDLNEVRQNILSGEVSFEDPCWDIVSEAAIDFIKSLLVLNPEKRHSANELQDHPWLKSMKRNSSAGSDESLSPTVYNSLVSFKELSSTRKFLREVISYTLQPDQIAGLHEEFEKIDVIGKGEISLHCFKVALIANSGQHPLTEEDIEDIFNGLKVRNTDLSIRWHEFIAACLSQCHIDDRNIRLAFDRLDNERKGFITLKDLKSAMDFYGSETRYDLQSMWINNIIDYKSDKEHMTFQDFYSLLKLDNDRDRECSSPMQLLRKSAPPQTGRARSTLARSYTVANAHSLDKETLALLTSPLDALQAKAMEAGADATPWAQYAI